MFHDTIRRREMKKRVVTIPIGDVDGSKSKGETPIHGPGGSTARSPSKVPLTQGSTIILPPLKPIPLP